MRTLVAFLLVTSAVFGQITVPATTPAHEPIVATATVPTTGDSQVLWEYPPAVRAIQLDAKTLHIWAPPGSHLLGATVITIDWDSRRFNVLKHAATFAVTGTPLPPGPLPPPVDDQPGPLATGLAVGVDRLVLAAFYRDFSDIVDATTTIKTTGQFREAQRVAITTLKQTKRWPTSDPSVDKAISERIAKAIGLDDSTIDGAKKAALVSVLRTIAEDF